MMITVSSQCIRRVSEIHREIACKIHREIACKIHREIACKIHREIACKIPREIACKIQRYFTDSDSCVKTVREKLLSGTLIPSTWWHSPNTDTIHMVAFSEHH